VQSGQLTPIDLIVEEHFHRAAPGGMGGTKAAGNYSPVLVTQLEAKRNNYAGVWTQLSCVDTVVTLC
jgi:branched-chain amino acid aminotransferase